MSTLLTRPGLRPCDHGGAGDRHAARSVRLQNRFRRLGSVVGRTRDEIVKQVGPPSHHTRLAGDREILEWRRVRFHIALSFSKGVCDGVMDVNAP